MLEEDARIVYAKIALLGVLHWQGRYFFRCSRRFFNGHFRQRCFTRSYLSFTIIIIVKAKNKREEMKIIFARSIKIWDISFVYYASWIFLTCIVASIHDEIKDTCVVCIVVYVLCKCYLTSMEVVFQITCNKNFTYPLVEYSQITSLKTRQSEKYTSCCSMKHWCRETRDEKIFFVVYVFQFRS